MCTPSHTLLILYSTSTLNFKNLKTQNELPPLIATPTTTLKWYDSSEREPIYSGKGQQEDRPYLPEPYNYQSPCGARKPNCPYNPQGESTRVTSGTIDSGYNMGVSHTTYNTNGNTNHNESSKGSGASKGWSYMREDEQAPSRGGSSNSGGSSDSNNNNNNNRDRDRDRSRDQQR